jgi:Spy/CpxP family protein refolding chaperone
MKKASRVLTMIAVLTVCLTGLSALTAGQGARGFGHCDSGHGDGHRTPIARVAHQLDLSDDQRGQLRATVDRYMEGELGQLMQNRRTQRHDLGRLIHDPSSDENAIVDAVRQTALDAERRALERHRLTVALFDILDEQQRAEARQRIAELPETGRPFGHGPHRGPHRGPPSGE